MFLSLRPLCNLRRVISLSQFKCIRYASNVFSDEIIREKRSRRKKLAPSRQERLDRINFNARSSLQYLDQRYNIFNENVHSVLDLGFMPGNWSEYARLRLSSIHCINEENFNTKCYIIGFDILCGTPPSGISTIQGNIFSKRAHSLIEEKFKEAALKRILDKRKKSKADVLELAYFFNEQNESLIDTEVDSSLNRLDKLSLEDSVEVSYKPDLILSDLTAPYPQQQGFFNNTNSKPYLRTGSNKILNKPIIDKDGKAILDLADAGLVLACDLLKALGSFFLRLDNVNHNDKEIDLLRARLKRVFKEVIEWTPVGLNGEPGSNELFFIALQKMEDSPNKVKVFSPNS